MQQPLTSAMTTKLSQTLPVSSGGKVTPARALCLLDLSSFATGLGIHLPAPAAAAPASARLGKQPALYEAMTAMTVAAQAAVWQRGTPETQGGAVCQCTASLARLPRAPAETRGRDTRAPGHFPALTTATDSPSRLALESSTEGAPWHLRPVG